MQNTCQQSGLVYSRSYTLHGPLNLNQNCHPCQGLYSSCAISMGQGIISFSNESTINIGQYNHFCILFRLVSCFHPDLFFAYDYVLCDKARIINKMPRPVFINYIKHLSYLGLTADCHLYDKQKTHENKGHGFI